MIKFTAQKDDGALFGFGLSEANLRKLSNGEPILVHLEEMGGEGEVLIFYGETDRDLVDKVQGGITSETNIIAELDSDE